MQTISPPKKRKLLKAHPRLRSRRMLRALGLIESGASIREAARAVGYASHQDVARYAASIGLTG